MNVSKLIKGPMVTLAPEATVQEASELLTTKGIGAIPILQQGMLVGIFSERDVVTRVVAKKKAPKETRLSEVMTHAVTTVKGDDTVDHALKVMLDGNFRHLVVVNEKHSILGMLSIRDLLRHRIDELRSENLRLIKSHF